MEENLCIDDKKAFQKYDIPAKVIKMNVDSFQISYIFNIFSNVIFK